MKSSVNASVLVLLVVLAVFQINTPQSVAAEPATRLSAPIPTEAGHFRLRYLTSVQDKPLDLCVVFSNSKKIAQAKGKIPVLIYLCGVGERGTTGDLIFVNGPAAEMQRSPELNDSMPLMIVSPQCDWDRAWGGAGPGAGMEAVVLGLVDLLKADPRIDADRIYLTGTSMGGKGTFLVAAAGPESFAAISPIAPAIAKPETVVPKIKDLPTWQIVGENNGNITKGAIAMDAALKAAGADEIFTELPGVGHQCWPLIYPKPEFYDWLLAHVRGKPSAKTFTSDDMMKIAVRPIDDPIGAAILHDFNTFSPNWQIVNCGHDANPALRPEINGHKDVFAARPLNAEIPCVMQTTWKIPADKHATLDIVVGRDNASDWRLVIEGDGKQLLNQPIDATTAKDGWLETKVDLGRWTGRFVHLDAMSFQSGDKPGPAYFAKLSVNLN